MPHRPSEPASAAATSLKSDSVALEAAAALTGAGIPWIVLRGPSIARHLYDNEEVRGYVDVDLLVPTRSVAAASRVLEELGFSYRAVLGTRPSDRPPWSSTWNRGDGGNVDLHWTIVGARVDSETVWNVLSEQTEQMDILGTQATGLGAAATALVVSLHAAHHGIEVREPLEDLRRGVERFPRDTWSAAAGIARALDATAAFAVGLRLVPAGAALAEELDLPQAVPAETILRASSAPPMALGFDWFAQTTGFSAKLRLVVGKLVPEPQFMRNWFAPARGGGRAALAVGYLWRPLWLAWHAIPGFRAWWLAARRARPGRRDRG